MQGRLERHAAIRRLVRSGVVETQHALVEQLRVLGCACTQGTVSRDIAQMGIVKLGGPKGAYALGDDLHLKTLLADKVSRIAPAGNIVVVRCEPTAAREVALALDQCAFGEVVGTVAGIDTVLVVCIDEMTAAEFEALTERLPWPYAEGRLSAPSA